ncbi:MAG: hypothetical protein ACLQU3_01215 [Limisphaerales bacterium]
MKLRYHPVETMQQLVTGPDDADFKKAVSETGPGTLIHCDHGFDRMGLAVGCYRLKEGWNKEAAWQEMTNHGYHEALMGLTHHWGKQ